MGRPRILLVATVALIGASLALTTPPANAAVPGGIGKIAFISDLDTGGTWEIYTRDFAGSTPLRITNNSVHDLGPQWSPDGSKLVWFGSDGSDWEIYSANADGSGLKQLTNNPYNNWYPSWSPDGSEIAFSSDVVGNRDIYVMDADGSNVVRLTLTSADDDTPAWSPDGTRIAFERQVAGNRDIWTVDRAGQDQQRLTTDPGPDTNPDWSPDSTMIAFNGAGPTGTEVFVMGRDGSGRTALTSTPGISYSGNPAWSPDGTKIAFESDRDGDLDIWMMGSDGSSQGHLTDNPANEWAVAWQSVNRAPIAHDDAAMVAAGGAVWTGPVVNDTDPEGDALTPQIVSHPAHGILSFAGADVSYQHNGDSATSDSFTYRAYDGKLQSKLATVTITIVHPPPTSVGLVDPTRGQWHLRDGTTGQVESFYFGNPGDVPFLGDWDCDGIATPGLFRTSDAYAYLSDANQSQVADIRFFFGNPSDVPLAGDFNGDGCDSLSIYRPSEQRFFIINRLGQNEGGLGAADYNFVFGDPGDQPVVGDWDGDGVDEVGLHRQTTGFFYYRNTLDTGNAHNQFFFGDPGDQFIGGDWGTVDGIETPAVFRPGTKTFYFRHTNTPGNADSEIVWGEAEWLPVSGPLG